MSCCCAYTPATRQGEVTIEEFCDGMSQLAISETPVESLQILKQLFNLFKNVVFDNTKD